ncbi:aminotransferase class I/II-fold pyridoxal phosphate-dependent enzyme [Pontibacter sp. E15-1]|uniref:pyridoxal phosphate-dependent decarboxylase family protein n=1 Tax=Pontibacter sp. E15-1 TaxID=2919918 RepID=UPI001F503C74|nr:aminotransferase class I/II-fold pyridoxal phosphate-dependent enzyme [Pontibacter sp. E15-1]MCJ8165076.1 aminotransferase class I/II-fold pyridoxal phosphate-dependent enzyme [Pontibacter sp. E15-1]
MADTLEQAFDAERFRSEGHQLIDMISDYLAGATAAQPGDRVMPWKAPEAQLAYWQDDFEQPVLQSALSLFEDVMANSVQIHQKRFMGHQTTPTLPVTILSSAVAALLNQGMGVYEMGMVGNTLEKILTEDLARLLGFGGEASGFITSGGSLGNLTALLAARAHSTEVWHKGNPENRSLAVLVSEEAHYCVDRAARIMGMGEEGVIKVPVNDAFQMRTDLLEEYLEKAKADGKQIICVIGCAGTTSTGSYDNLAEIARFSQRHGIWFHVDGAHGAPAAWSPKYRHLVSGIEQADSVVVDYHKMMMTPSLSTALLFKRSGDAYKTFSQRAQYLWAEQESEEWYNGGKRSFECTKAMSALNVYAIYRTHGRDVFRQNIERLYGLATELAAILRTDEAFELAYEPACNIVCFRLRAADNPEQLNQAIRRLVVEDGRFYIVQTILKSGFFLRVTLMNPFTTATELHELLQHIQEKAAVVQAAG